MTDNLDENSNSSNVVEIPDDAKPEDFPDLLEKTIVTFNTGDVIEGTVVRIDRNEIFVDVGYKSCLLYTSPSPRDATLSRMPSSA